MKVVEQYLINFFFQCGAVSFDFVEQYLLISWSSIPNQFQKGLGYAVVKTVGFSGNCTRVAQGLHKGCTRTAQGQHKDRTVHVFSQLFLLFKLERRNLGAQGHFKFSVAHGHFKFSVARGHFRISVAHGQFKFSVALGHINGDWPKMRFDIFFENSCTRVYGDWPKMRFDIFLKIHVPGSTEIGQK